jgi:hypothetical protein
MFAFFLKLNNFDNILNHNSKYLISKRTSFEANSLETFFFPGMSKKSGSCIIDEEVFHPLARNIKKSNEILSL